MSLPIPNLDNRTFEQLLQESRKSISNYAAQWTNHNPADPGITLIELFAWLAEITSYRINLVTEEHRLKYLKLLGIRPRGILPATADLIFEAEDEMHLEKGTVFLAEKAGEKIDFEISENITVIPIHLEKIIVNEASADLSTDSSSKFSQFPKLSKGIFDRSVTTTKEDLFFAPFGMDTRKNSELYLGFSLKSRRNVKEDHEYPYKILNFMCYLYEKGLVEPGKHGNEAEYEFGNENLKWEISLSPDGKQWKEVLLKDREDRTQNFRKTGSFIFTKLEGWVPSLIEDIWASPEKKKFFWLRCTLLESEYEYPPRIEKISLNTATVVQKKRVKDGLLAESNGLPDQVFKLPKPPVPRGSLELVVSGEKWIEVEDFDGSGPESPHFTLESLKGEIRFGNGLRGKVPRDGTVIRALEYKTEKGEQGNPQDFYKSNGFPDQVFKLPETPVLRGSIKLVVSGEKWIEVAKSNGLPNQFFVRPETPVPRGSIKLVVSGEEWKKVEDFDGSGPESPHFTLESLKGEIRFGDGLRGKVPRDGTEIRALEWEEWIEVEDFDGSGPESPHFTLESLKGEIKFGDGIRGKVPRDGTEIHALEYETGKGEQGNLQAFSKWEVKGEKIEGLKINNFKPANGGKREESITEAFERFNRDMKIPYSAVTSEDFEYITRQTPGLRIAQAKVIKNFDPYLLADIDGSVTVIIIPFSPLDNFNSLPEPSRGFIDAVARHLEKHRLLGTRIHVVSPEYVRVEVRATLVISKGFSEESVRKNIIDKLNTFLHPIKGGASENGWPVGEPVYRSVVIRTIMEIEGVDWVEKIYIHTQQGAKPNGDGDLILDSKIATVYSGQHSIEVLRREGKQ